MLKPHPAPRGAEPIRIDDVLVRMRRLVDSSEPAIVFSSLARLCVPLFCDAVTIDIVEGGRVRYRIDHPQPPSAGAAPRPGEVAPSEVAPSEVASSEVASSEVASSDVASSEVVTTFESALPGWPSYTGVMRSRWRSRVATNADDARAAAIVDHAIRLIRAERLADPVRSGLPGAAPHRERRSTLH